MSNEELSFAAIAVSRLRMVNDGAGVTTLVAGHGCTLRCRYCINPQCFMEDRPFRVYSVSELIDILKIDDLYFQATGGGVVFGGGEPLLQADFIHEFCIECPKEWKISLESSLSVPKSELEKVLQDIDFFLIDIKDMNPEIYEAYTGKDIGLLLDNLKYLAAYADPEKICIRIPLIEGFNTDEDRKKSSSCLKLMGFKHFDFFNYNLERAEEKFREAAGRNLL